MLIVPTSNELLALRLQLLGAGSNVVPSSPRDKGCHVVGWPDIHTSELHLEKWQWSFSAQTNTAVVCNKNYFGTDIDILSDPSLAHRVQALAFEYLVITGFIRVGRWPKR